MSGTWQTVDIAGKPADVFAPEGKPRFGVLFLHDEGGETLRDRFVFTQLFDELRLACVCPHGKQSWWLDKVCAEFDAVLSAEAHVVEHVRPYFAGAAALLLGIGWRARHAHRVQTVGSPWSPPSRLRSTFRKYNEGTLLDDMYESSGRIRVLQSRRTTTRHTCFLHRLPTASGTAAMTGSTKK